MATSEVTAHPRGNAGTFTKSALRSALSFLVLLAAFLVVADLLVARSFHVDSDTWWHMVVGERILKTHSWPTSDAYSFTAPGASWIAYEWLGEVVLALAWRLGGLSGLMALLLAMTSTMVLLLYYYASLCCGNAKAAFVACMLVLPLAGVWFTVHPQLLGYTFLVATLACLERFRQGHRKSLWALPAVFLLWVNTHGTFAFGFLAFVIYWASGLAPFQALQVPEQLRGSSRTNPRAWEAASGSSSLERNSGLGTGLVGFRAGSLVAERWKPQQRRDLVVVCLLSVLAACVTPYGTRLAAYPAQMALFQQNIVASMTSWQPPRFDLWPGKVLLGFVLLFLLAQVALQPIWRLEQIGLLLFAIYMACVHSRTLLLFALVFAPFLASLLARWVPKYNAAQERYVLNAFLILLLGAGLLRFFPPRQDLQQDVANVYPQRAVEYLREHPVRAPMLNELAWGGYLLWTLATDHKVFIDGRSDFYEYGGVYSDYLRIVGLHPETFALLSRYNVQSCLVGPESALSALLAASPEWHRVYTDRLSVIFVRKEPR